MASSSLLDDRWWAASGGPLALDDVETALLAPDAPEGSSFLAAHRMLSRVLNTAASMPLLSAQAVRDAVNAAAGASGLVSKTEEDFWTDARQGVELVVSRALRAGVDPGTAARRASLVAGVPARRLSQFALEAAKPAQPPGRLEAMADRLLFSSLRSETLPAASEPVDKATATATPDWDFERKHPRNSDGTFRVKTPEQQYVASLFAQAEKMKQEDERTGLALQRLRDSRRRRRRHAAAAAAEEARAQKPQQRAAQPLIRQHAPLTRQQQVLQRERGVIPGRLEAITRTIMPLRSSATPKVRTVSGPAVTDLFERTEVDELQVAIDPDVPEHDWLSKPETPVLVQEDLDHPLQLEGPNSGVMMPIDPETLAWLRIDEPAGVTLHSIYEDQPSAAFAERGLLDAIVTHGDAQEIDMSPISPYSSAVKASMHAALERKDAQGRTTVGRVIGPTQSRDDWTEAAMMGRYIREGRKVARDENGVPRTLRYQPEWRSFKEEFIAEMAEGLGIPEERLELHSVVTEEGTEHHLVDVADRYPSATVLYIESPRGRTFEDMDTSAESFVIAERPSDAKSPLVSERNALDELHPVAALDPAHVYRFVREEVVPVAYRDAETGEVAWMMLHTAVIAPFGEDEASKSLTGAQLHEFNVEHPRDHAGRFATKTSASPPMSLGTNLMRQAEEYARTGEVPLPVDARQQARRDALERLATSRKRRQRRARMVAAREAEEARQAAALQPLQRTQQPLERTVAPLQRQVAPLVRDAPLVRSYVAIHLRDPEKDNEEEFSPDNFVAFWQHKAARRIAARLLMGVDSWLPQAVLSRHQRAHLSDAATYLVGFADYSSGGPAGMWMSLHDSDGALNAPIEFDKTTFSSLHALTHKLQENGAYDLAIPKPTRSGVETWDSAMNVLTDYWTPTLRDTAQKISPHGSHAGEVAQRAIAQHAQRAIDSALERYEASPQRYESLVPWKVQLSRAALEDALWDQYNDLSLRAQYDRAGIPYFRGTDDDDGMATAYVGEEPAIPSVLEIIPDHADYDPARLTRVVAVWSGSRTASRANPEGGTDHAMNLPVVRLIVANDTEDR